MKNKLEKQILSLKGLYRQLQERICIEVELWKKNFNEIDTELKRTFTDIFDKSNNLVDEKIFRLEIENFYQEEQIKELKNLLEK